MAMNGKRIIVGGLAAGVVLNVIDFVTNGYLLKDRMTAEMNSVAAGLAERLMSGSNAAAFIISDFIVGIMLVWLYAAIRPRFGAGPRTAFFAAIFMWIIGGIFYWPWVALGMMTTQTYCMGAVVQIINVLLAAWIGGMLYTEEAAV